MDARRRSAALLEALHSPLLPPDPLKLKTLVAKPSPMLLKPRTAPPTAPGTALRPPQDPNTSLDLHASRPLLPGPPSRRHPSMSPSSETRSTKAGRAPGSGPRQLAASSA